MRSRWGLVQQRNRSRGREPFPDAVRSSRSRRRLVKPRVLRTLEMWPSRGHTKESSKRRVRRFHGTWSTPAASKQTGERTQRPPQRVSSCQASHRILDNTLSVVGKRAVLFQCGRRSRAFPRKLSDAERRQLAPLFTDVDLNLLRLLGRSLDYSPVRTGPSSASYARAVIQRLRSGRELPRIRSVESDAGVRTERSRGSR